MTDITNQMLQLESELAQKDEYIEQCYVCGGCLLRKFAKNKRIACEAGVTITAVTETSTSKTNLRVEGGELKEVYTCERCERKLINGEVVATYQEGYDE